MSYWHESRDAAVSEGGREDCVSRLREQLLDEARGELSGWR